MQSRFTLYVIVIEDRGELGRMVFRYTQADAEVIREMFAGKDNLDFVQVDDGEKSLVVVGGICNNSWCFISALVGKDFY